MDRLPQILARAIVFCSLLVVISIVAVLLHLWLGGPSESASPAGRVRRPVLVNEPDGSIYDLNLKIETLERRLGQEELRGRKLAEDLGAGRKENEKMAGRVRLLEGEVARLRKPTPLPGEPQPPGTGGGPAAPTGTGDGTEGR